MGNGLSALSLLRTAAFCEVKYCFPERETIPIAYYYAQNQYIIHREFATGKGYADLVFIPRKTVDAPALVVELKREQSAGTAITQIKEKNYPEKIREYTGKILLVGINYSDDKGHSCIIEEVKK